jgi:PKD repeat protein
MRSLFILLYFLFLPLSLSGQDCSILSKSNNIIPDKLCSPVAVVWQVSYTGVNNAGRPVQIQYDWNDGNVVTVPATNSGPGVFQATSNHSYVSTGDRCNYHPVATLIVNGVICSSSSQEQIVTVWDNDDQNGGHMHISPTVYPICVGNGANVRFQDLTQFNCVPPQEEDVPNLYTRWVQWIYGTDITMSLPVPINGIIRPFPYYGPVIMLPGPVTGSGVYSDIINVANNKALGSYFQVTLRNWNYCNPYDDPNIPGPPADPVNGDNDPVTTTAIILIVPYPDATITPVDTLCVQHSPVTLHGHDPGGTWSGDGVTGNSFNPAAAGPGNHVITYQITDGNSCSDADQITITVMPAPIANINSVPTQIINGPPVVLIATPPGGTFSGNGMTLNTFSPAAAGIGIHVITYRTLTDRFGCFGTDTIHIRVRPIPPDATITPVDTLCVQSSPVTLQANNPGGTWSGDGVTGNIFDPAVAGVGNHTIHYVITDAYGYSASDQIIITVMPPPVVSIVHLPVLFINGTPVILIATPTGGTFSGNGVTGGIFYPGTAGIGTHTITYHTLTDRFGCSSSDTIHIKVRPIPPDATITQVDTLCVQSSPVTLHAHDPGGTWSGDGVISDMFYPALAGVGNHIIRYTITDIYGYTDSDQITITVTPPPVVNINSVPVQFINDPPILLVATPPGGTFTGIGMSNATFTPAVAGLGTHIITYQTLRDRYGCIGTDTIHIRVLMARPDATIDRVDTLCVQTGAITLTAHDQGGTWSGDGVVNDKFYPAVAGVGNHIIRYQITNADGYSDADQITITVMPPPVTNINPVPLMYINDPPILLSATPPGGTFTGIGILTGTFYPGSAGVGKFLINYQTITDKYGCTGRDTIYIKVMMPPAPKSVFSPDTAGCSPLSVQFRNLSVSGESYFWDFGDKTFSSSKNPLHTYYIPGDYIVKLTAINISGQSTSTKIISVYQNPTALFTVYPTNVINNTQVVVFTNNSFYGETFLWEFGDGEISSESNTWHKYASEGIYNISLTVTSKEGCVDSMKYNTPVIVSYKTGEIKFPNAFKWNLSGPTGGYWNENQLNDNIFRPFSINVIDYKLQIFNRWGVLIYESRDLHKGWDGYFGNGHLALEGVYVWKVTGQFADGTYFTKVGDVTFLH